MGEESHLDEMRSAIRGDFERLAERRGEQALMRVDADPAQRTAVSDVEAGVPEIASPAEPPVELREEHEGKPRSWFMRFIAP